MKKVLAIVSLAALMCSCMQPRQNGETSASASSVAEKKAPKVKDYIFAHVADSIFKLHPGDIKNPIIREDIGKDLKKYAMQFKGKHMPLIEELPFICKSITQEGNHYLAGFKYQRDATETELGIELQVAVVQSREDAAKLIEGDIYYLKGIMAGFPFQRVLPYALDPLFSYNKPLLSLGAIKLENAEIIKK